MPWQKYLSALGGPLVADAKKPGKEALAAAVRGGGLFTRLGCVKTCHGRRRGKPRNISRRKERGRRRLGSISAARVVPLRGLEQQIDRENAGELSAKPSCSQRHQPDAAHAAEPKRGSRPGCVPGPWPNRGRGHGASAEPSAAERLAAFQRVETRADEVAEFTKLSAPSEMWLELGKRLVLEKGCNSCHTIEPEGKPFASVLPGIDLEDLGKPEKLERGCLAEKPSKVSKSPRYVYTGEERAAVKAFLTRGLSGAGSPAPQYAARLDLQRFNCLACHTRDGEGGLDAAAARQAALRAGKWSMSKRSARQRSPEWA